ncbi:TPR-like protein, partial [Mycena pura]
LNMLGYILFKSYCESGTVDDVNQTVCAYSDAVRDDTGHVGYLASLGRSLQLRFERLGSLLDSNQSVDMLEDALRLTPDGHLDIPERLNDLGLSLLRRFQRLGDLSDINKAVLMLEDAVQLTPDGHPDKPGRLNNLGNSLARRYERLGDLSDINKSVFVKEDAVQLTPDGHPDKPGWLNNLGNSLLHRFKRLSDLSDINKSVLMLEDAVQLTPDGHPDKPFVLNNLGNSFVGRFEWYGDLSDINKSVLMLEDAVKRTPDGHPERPTRLNNLGNSFLRRFERLGDLSDIKNSVLMFEDAVQLTPDGHPDKPSWLNNLGGSLVRWFKQDGDLSDINKSVLMFEDAVELTPDGHPDKPRWLNNLGNSLLHRFQRLGDLTDINKSVLMAEDAVQLTPDGHPNKPSLLNNLGNSFLSRFERLGDLSDINKAVLMFEDAVQLTPDGHPEKPSFLNNLGNSLSRRSVWLGDLSDINKSVLMLENAVRLTPDGHLDKPKWLNNLGESLFKRFLRLGDLSDINKSVLIAEDAVQLTPDGHSDKPSRLSSLGTSLLGRFERLGDLSDINKAVLMLEDAVELTPDGHPDKLARLSNLGSSFLTRFERLGDLSDINKSVVMFENAIQLIPEKHRYKPSLLNNLGNSLSCRFEQLHNPEDSWQLVLHYTSAACSTIGSAHIRFAAANSWAKHAHIIQPSSIIHAYTTAINLLPEVAWLGLSITDRHYHLSKAGQVVREAASAAIAMQDYQMAVEWLDQGRSVIWGQFLNLRTPVDELREKYPVLADRLVSLSKLLETTGANAVAVADATKLQSLQLIAEQSHAIALERNHVLQLIRAIPRFEKFLLPKRISELSMAAKKGPVAIVNISDYGCDALILTPGHADKVIHVPLTDFTIHKAQDMVTDLASIVGAPGRSDRLYGSVEGYKAPEDIISHILSELWFGIVRPILNALAIITPVSQDLKRIWWCPTGPLAFLPIHAAGLYGEDQAFGSKLSDFLISSYTPSLTALIEGYRSQSESQARLQLLAVTQPSAEGQFYIPGTQDEIKCIKRHAKGKVPVLWLNEDMATIENVQKGMKESRWVHFACHGMQKSTPTESALLLAGSSQLKISDIIQLNLPHADLAFLSACQTATGSIELQDESVHLTASMLLAGYRGVIGTMWSIGDNIAPQVAGDVYAYLLKASPPDPTRAAEALHLAIKSYQEQLGANKSFFHWVPFIHFGV